ncbi:hypothetical protein Naga_100354g6 [Nannochloropsis gaditana]|uniref:Uncharacterized protein n=1 Tax=Nannochloropsis gaditana TaxID=72520 RepID=W7TMR3_9STRA|nr:hypothetical protein Naga_100354g6 [Nannochloropsis gaditana]
MFFILVSVAFPPFFSQLLGLILSRGRGGGHCNQALQARENERRWPTYNLIYPFSSTSTRPLYPFPPFSSPLLPPPLCSFPPFILSPRHCRRVETSLPQVLNIQILVLCSTLTRPIYRCVTRRAHHSQFQNNGGGAKTERRAFERVCAKLQVTDISSISAELKRLAKLGRTQHAREGCDVMNRRPGK